MTKVLLITNKSDVTTDFIVKELKKLNVDFYRLNTEEIGSNLELSFNFSANEHFLYDGKVSLSINLFKIKSVYFRRPKLKSLTNSLSQAELNFINSELWFALEGLYQILNKSFWLNKVEDIRRAENKILQLLIAKEIGFKVPASIVTNHPESLNIFYKKNKKSCIIKPIKSGLIESKQEESVVFTSRFEIDNISDARIKECPTYLQKLIHKEADIRITIVGTNVFAAKIHSQENDESKVDWRKSSIPLKYSIVHLPQAIIAKCLELMKRLNLNFGAIDMILNNKGEYIFLEINPNGQWAWIERQLNFPIAETITKYLIEKTN